ncbi:MAG: helix-turn-helix transcriptional regulator [bacterium]|nr:helix-turn-helix transcriptional regulator [bacterium]
MAFYDTDILIRNIKKLMDDNNITQSALAGILGMSQSNVSKALSENDKKSFTLDQLAGIAKHFKVSIDKLIGNERSQSQIISPLVNPATFTSGIRKFLIS